MEVTEEHKIAMSLNAKNMNSVFKPHEKVLDDKTNELINMKQELQRVLVTIKMKLFSFKICDKAFHQVHEVKEHIKIHHPISGVEELRNQVKSLKTQVEEL